MAAITHVGGKGSLSRSFSLSLSLSTSMWFVGVCNGCYHPGESEGVSVFVSVSMSMSVSVSVPLSVLVCVCMCVRVYACVSAFVCVHACAERRGPLFLLHPPANPKPERHPKLPSLCSPPLCRMNKHKNTRSHTSVSKCNECHNNAVHHNHSSQVSVRRHRDSMQIQTSAFKTRI